MMTLEEIRAIPPAEQVAIFERQALFATPGKLVFPEQFAETSGDPPPRATMNPAVRDAVNACPDRGGELPVSAYVLEGCCAGSTRFECKAGKGKVPGQPTLQDCLDCRTAIIAASPQAPSP